MNKYFIFWSILVFIGCQKQELTFEKLKDNDDLSSYRVYLKDKPKIQISFDSLGNINSIYNKVPGGVQSIHYFSNGMVDGKVLSDYKIQIQGRVHYFQEITGHIQAIRQYKNDTLEGYQFYYYDQEGTDSIVEHYINGKCMGRLVLDKKEKAISVSGSFIAK